MRLTDYVTLGLVAFTSLLAYGAGVRGLGLRRDGLRPAFRFLLDVLGSTVIFFLANAVVGVAVLLALRHLTRLAVSLYILDDVVLGALSLFQAAVFQAWRRSWPATPPESADAEGSLSGGRSRRRRRSR